MRSAAPDAAPDEPAGGGAGTPEAAAPPAALGRGAQLAIAVFVILVEIVWVGALVYLAWLAVVR